LSGVCGYITMCLTWQLPLILLLALLHWPNTAGGTDASGSPTEGMVGAYLGTPAGAGVGGTSPAAGGSPDESAAAGNVPPGVGAVLVTPGAITPHQAAAPAAAAAAANAGAMITAGGVPARFSSVTNPSNGTGYATPLTPATAFLAGATPGAGANTPAALIASAAVQAEMQNGNAAGGGQGWGLNSMAGFHEMIDVAMFPAAYSPAYQSRAQLCWSKHLDH
jgi:hypothetical protein